MIVTLTANPAIDLNFTADRLAFDDRAYLQERSEAPGGRGINASLVLHSLGVETLAIAASGGITGKRFESFLANAGFAVEFVQIEQDIRTNYAITDRQGLTVKLDEQGPVLSPGEVTRLRDAVLQRLPGADWLLLSGSLPPGVPANFYQQLIENAGKHKVRTLLDCGGQPLLEGLDARPTLVAPNQNEAEHVLDRALVMRKHFHEAAAQISAMGAESVVLSLGSRGATVSHRGSIVEVIPPRTDAVCPIGSGDALNAALIWAVTEGCDFFDAVRWGVAAGTASARLPGLEFARLDQIREVYAEVEVRPVD